ncbi:MAG TPA: hypothetical protein VKZ53_08795, partial [Candidatus Angelobacter sp.]|nr:hypothetical protein [Candidatus Angelobacter sp.]
MNRAGSSLGLWLLHVGSVCLALALVATFAAGRAVAFVNDDGDRPAEVIQIPSQETEIADDIHLAVGYVSVVKVPEEIASVSLTDATNFKAEIVPADGREARLTLLNTQADQGSVVIGTRQGHLMTLRLVNISAQPGRRTVDLFVEYQGDFSSLQRSVVYGFPRSVAQREKYAEPAASSPTQAMPLKHENAAVASTVTNPQAPPQNTSLPAAKPSPAPAPETAALAKPVLAPSIPASAAPTQPTVKPAVAVSGSTSTKPSATVVTPQPAESFPQMGSLGREHAQVLRRPLPPESQSQKQESQGRQGDRPQEDQTRSKQKQNRPEPDQPAPPEAVRAQKTLPQDQPALRTIALRDEPKPREISSSSNLDPGLGTGISPSLFIGPGDLLEISVYGAAELSQKIRV